LIYALIYIGIYILIYIYTYIYLHIYIYIYIIYIYIGIYIGIYNGQRKEACVQSVNLYVQLKAAYTSSVRPHTLAAEGLIH